MLPYWNPGFPARFSLSGSGYAVVLASGRCILLATTAELPAQLAIRLSLHMEHDELHLLIMDTEQVS